MRPYPKLALIALILLAPIALAQHEKRDPLTESQVNQIREAGIDPANRINLYTKFINEHAEKIKKLANHGRSPSRTQQLDNELQDYTALLDEIGSNLDQYSERKSDLRPAMKPLSEASARWLAILRALAGEPGFDVSRKDALEATDDIASEAARIQTEQEAYFATHKDEKGQQMAEPK